MDLAEVTTLVLGKLAEKELAIACCCCKLWKEIGTSDELWREFCMRRWPGCDAPEALRLINAMGGFRSFFSRRCSAMHLRQSPPRPWLQLDHLTFFIDLSYKGVPAVSEVISGSLAGNGFNVRLQIDPAVVTDSVHPREALTSSLYQGQLYYTKPFQKSYTSNYLLNWSVVRSTDNRVACLLHSSPVPDGIVPWEDEGDGGDDFCLPLLFQWELCACESTLLTYACLECRPLWGDSLSESMRFEMVELQLGVWKSDERNTPPVDKVLFALQELEWK